MAMELSPTVPVYPAACSSNPRSSARASRTLAMAAQVHAENNNVKPPLSSSSSSSSSIPKMEPFNRSRVSRLIKEPSLLEKAEHAISDRCIILEGDDAYECWEALFEFEKMKEDYTGQCTVASASERQTACRPLERLENFVRQSGGVASLINNVRMLARANEMRKSSDAATQAGVPAVSIVNDVEDGGKNMPFFEPGDLPPSEEELELERSAMMPESPFTRVLRAVGIPAPWFGHPAG